MGVKPRDRRPQTKLETPAMQEFYIIKEKPTKNCVSGADNRIYFNEKEAVENARQLTTNTRRGFVVMKAIRAFDVADVVEVPIKQGVERRPRGNT